MKIILITLFIVIYSASSAQTKGAFEIRGDVSAVSKKVTIVYYRYKLNGITIEDSALVKNNHYLLKGMIDEHVMLQSSAVYDDTSLKYDYKRDYNTIHITPGTNAVVKHGNLFSRAEVKGSAVHDEYMMLHPKLVKGETGFIPDYIQQHPNSPLAIFLLNQFVIGPFLDAEIHEPFYNLLSDANKKTPSGKKLKEQLDINKKTALGKKATEVSQKDPKGNIIKLSDFKGKYVLLEFWASWCMPCRKENPNLVKIYERFKTKNFEIFGISVDENKKNWLAAIEKDGLTWTNTADLLNEEKNPAAIAFGVVGIPNNFLINPEGVIIGKDLKGIELEKRLEKLLSK